MVERGSDFAVSPLPRIHHVQIIHNILHDVFMIDDRLLHTNQLLHQHLILHEDFVEALRELLKLLLRRY